ncbi:uncharacterized protein LOC129580044 [Sitodiplosis mosellana]|uniref:uncharacterized protein LOC129580044 n=2 Tax=Sitodiplosis mosellana TaxID=263140 RepID=UPI002444E2BD|nr:uncharacterized protein LOC129580044 [Sitodiplosis mosellana]
MAQDADSIVYKNVLPWRGCEKLYLNTRTADVFFVFESDDEDTVKIGAHKSILSANSEAFDAMFYGPAKQEGDIPIVDSTPEAFKEFLQFFYLGTVKLTADNAAGVWNLGKQYMVDDCSMASSNFSEQTLTLDNMCWGYELAILFEQDRLMKFCEQKISENPKEIFKSNGFLTCGSNVLARILQLESLNCDESVVFDGCVAWAKAACIQKGLDETNMQNLRNQLGDLFYEIRFGDMTAEKFFMRYRAYEKMFSTEECKDIFGMIASMDYQPPKFNRNARMAVLKLNKNTDQLICDRIDPTCHHEKYSLQNSRDDTVFSSNCTLLLKAIQCNELFHYEFACNKSTSNAAHSTNTIPAVMNVIELSNERWEKNDSYYQYNKKTIYGAQVILHSSHGTIVHLSTPIVIRPDRKYNITFEVTFDGCYTLMTMKRRVQMEQGVEIGFHERKFGQANSIRPHLIHANGNQGLVKQLIFVKFEE